MSPRPGYLVITPLFPTNLEPTRGGFVRNQLVALARKVPLHVVCPVALYPPLKLIRSKNLRTGNFDRHYKVDGLDVTYVRYLTLPVIGRWINWLPILIALLWHVRPSGYSAILSFWIYPDSLAAVILGKLFRLPVVVSARGTDIHGLIGASWAHPQKLLTYATVANADRVLSVSEPMKDQMVGWGIEPGKVRVVSNGVDTTLFRPRPQGAARTALGLPHDRRILLYVGWLEPHKGIDCLIDALATVRRACSDVLLLLVGDGYAQPALEQLVDRHGLRDAVRFVGHRPHHDIPGWLNACDVFCLPSHNEGCPNVVVEALACGVPIVATNVGGIPQLLSPSSGLLVAPGDREATAHALIELLSNPLDRAVIASNHGRTWELVAEEVFACCEESVLGRATGDGPSRRLAGPARCDGRGSDAEF